MGHVAAALDGPFIVVKNRRFSTVTSLNNQKSCRGLGRARALADMDHSLHPGIGMVRHIARINEIACLGEVPDQPACLSRGNGHCVGLIHDHVRHSGHFLFVPGMESGVADCKLMRDCAATRDLELDYLAPGHRDGGGTEAFVGCGDEYGSVRQSRISRFAEFSPTPYSPRSASPSRMAVSQQLLQKMRPKLSTRQSMTSSDS